jgi:hypothetical protein
LASLGGGELPTSERRPLALAAISADGRAALEIAQDRDYRDRSHYADEDADGAKVTESNLFVRSQLAPRRSERVRVQYVFELIECLVGALVQEPRTEIALGEIKFGLLLWRPCGGGGGGALSAWRPVLVRPSFATHLLPLAAGLVRELESRPARRWRTTELNAARRRRPKSCQRCRCGRAASRTIQMPGKSPIVSSRAVLVFI